MVGGAAVSGGSFKRDDEAFRTTTTGCEERMGLDRSVLHIVEDECVRVKITGEGDGVVEGEGETDGEPDCFRRS